MKRMGDRDSLLTFVICSEDLHRVAPLLCAIGGRNEMNLSARMEALELSQKTQLAELKRLITAKSFSDVTKKQPPVGEMKSVFAPPPTPPQIIVADPPVNNGFQRGRSNSVKRRKVGDSAPKDDSATNDASGDWATVKRRVKRNTNAGSAKVDYDLGGISLSAPKEFWVGGVNPKIQDKQIADILVKCARNLNEQSEFEVADIVCLTRDELAKSKSFKITVDAKHAKLMMDSQIYPEGWRHREFTQDKTFYKRGFNNGDSRGRANQLNLP